MAKRLTTPLVRRKGLLLPTSWDDALALVASRLRAVAQREGPGAIGGIGSTHTTNEEAHLLQKPLRARLGTHNIYQPHRRLPAHAPDTPPSVLNHSNGPPEQGSHH